MPCVHVLPQPCMCTRTLKLDVGKARKVHKFMYASRMWVLHQLYVVLVHARRQEKIRIGVLNYCTISGLRSSMSVMSTVPIPLNSHCTQQNSHSCSCMECCTAGESLSLHYYTTGLDLTWPPLIYAGVCVIILLEHAFTGSSTLLFNLLLAQGMCSRVL